MSQHLSLVCKETKQRIWIGQGMGEMSVFYHNEPELMKKLQTFLNDHRDKDIVFLCNDQNDYVYDYKSYDYGGA